MGWIARRKACPRSHGGETLQAILAEQFTRTRDGDRFWYQNYLSRKMQRFIERQTLATIIKRNTNIKKLQANVFRVRFRGHAGSYNRPGSHPFVEQKFKKLRRSFGTLESLIESLDD